MTGWKRIFNEPVTLISLVRQLLYVLTMFAVITWDEKQMAAVMVLVDGGLTFLARTVVTPNHLAESRVVDGRSPTNRDVSLRTLQEEGK